MPARVPGALSGGLRPRVPLASGAPGHRQGAQASRTVIDLESGGVVTLSVEVDLFELSDRDREFVLKLIDLTKGYLEDKERPGVGEEGSEGEPHRTALG